MLEIKKRGRPKGSKNKPKTAKKPKEKKPLSTIPNHEEVRDPILDDSIIDDLDAFEKSLENLTGESLDDENKRAMIRARNQQAAKQKRINDIQSSRLVEKEMAVKKMVDICSHLLEQLNLMPDQLTNQLHKRTKKEIRDKLVKQVDSMKKGIVEFIEVGI